MGEDLPSTLERAPGLEASTDFGQFAAGHPELADLGREVILLDDVVDEWEVQQWHETTRRKVEAEAGSNPEIIRRQTDVYSYVREYQEALKSNDAETADLALEQLRVNVRTYIFEGLMRYGHVSTIVSHWDERRGAFVAGHTPVSERLVRGELASHHHLEKPRRESEARTEHKKEYITRHRPELWRDHVLVTISPYLHGADDKTAEALGYSAPNKKYMIRTEEVVDGRICITEQLSMSGSDLDFLNRQLRQRGIISSGENLDDASILDRAFLMRKSALPHRTASLAQQFDQDMTGEVFAGGRPNGDNYETLAEVSRRREERAEKWLDEAVRQILGLGTHTNRAYRDITKRMALAICDADREVLVRARGAIGESAYRVVSNGGDLLIALDVMNNLVGCGGVEINQAVHDQVGGTPRAAEPGEEGVYGSVVFENAKCIGCPASNTKVGQDGYCGGCAKACTEPKENPAPINYDKDGSEGKFSIFNIFVGVELSKASNN